MLWMGIGLHTHTVTTTDVSSDVGELADNLGNVSVKSMPLHYGWDCKTFQTAEIVEPFKLHTTPMSYIKKVFEHLLFCIMIVVA